MFVLQKYQLKNNGNTIQLKYWMEDGERMIQEVSRDYKPDEHEDFMKLPMIEVTQKQLEGLIILAGLSF